MHPSCQNIRFRDDYLRTVPKIDAHAIVSAKFGKGQISILFYTKEQRDAIDAQTGHQNHRIDIFIWRFPRVSKLVPNAVERTSRALSLNTMLMIHLWILGRNEREMDGLYTHKVACLTMTVLITVNHCVHTYLCALSGGRISGIAPGAQW